MRDFFKKNSLLGGTSCKEQGNAKEPEIQKIALQEFGLSQKNLICCKQIHSNKVVIVEDCREKLILNADGLITEQPDLILGIFTADCMPIFLYDPTKKVTALLHAGWRGIQSGIVRSCLVSLKDFFKVNASSLQIYLGPHIEECCYEVGEEVASLFPKNSWFGSDGKKIKLSLKKAVLEQLLEYKVSLINILAPKQCTYCSPNFFSYRREPSDNRMLSFLAQR
ncbi:MAG: peptidoglycan editing factor PgeF [Elusimicrobia bacterium]|nr:peptidoglycan editing factor PgeF [Elusimicrobiota bacterium]